MSIHLTEIWRLLLVDDDREDYIIFKDLLNFAQGTKFSLEWTPTYESAEQLLNSNQYDAVFVDYDLGSHTGINLIRETVNRGYPAPLILLTGRGSYEVDLEAMDAGATFYLTKDEINPLSLERFIRYAVERKRTEQVLREQTIQIELHHRLLEYREQERQKIARELHDGPIQELLALLMNIRFKRSMVTDQDVKKEFDTVEMGLDNAIQTLRAMIKEIRPPNLVRFGLTKAIQFYLDDFQCKHPEIELHINLLENELYLTEQARFSLFRILQEAITNTVKHANTKRIEVNMSLKDQQAVLKIRDEGAGFSVSNSMLEYSSCGHYGLIGMKEQAEAIGGQLSIKSRPGKGTTILVSVPVLNQKLN
jgi:signal transduction histidine kinase